ncbi:MAG: RasGEF domain-containing protein, partial [archaeon]|nr:RasGEF domain-containing protein [archaeon]
EEEKEEEIPEESKEEYEKRKLEEETKNKELSSFLESHPVTDESNTHTVVEEPKIEEKKEEKKPIPKFIIYFKPDINPSESNEHLILDSEGKPSFMSLELIVKEILLKPNGTFHGLSNKRISTIFFYQQSAFLEHKIFLDVINYLFDKNPNEPNNIEILNNFLMSNFHHQIFDNRQLKIDVMSLYSKLNPNQTIKFINGETVPSKIIQILKEERQKVRAYAKLICLADIQKYSFPEKTPPIIFAKIDDIQASKPEKPTMQYFDKDGRKLNNDANQITDIIDAYSKERNFIIQDWSAVEIARQLTIITSYLFHKIEENELTLAKFTKKDKATTSPFITMLINRFNQICLFICEEILSNEYSNIRVKIIEKFIEVADELRKLKNYNDCFNVITALNHFSIKRLKMTWGKISQESLEKFKEITLLCAIDKNWFTLRKCYQEFIDQKENERTSPCIPYFGYFSRDLAFIEEGPKYLNEHSMLNIDKLLKVGKVFEEIKLFQKYHYNFKIAFPFSFLSELNPLDGDELSKLSRSVESDDPNAKEKEFSNKKKINKRISRTFTNLSGRQKLPVLFNEYLTYSSILDVKGMSLEDYIRSKFKKKK